MKSWTKTVIGAVALAIGSAAAPAMAADFTFSFTGNDLLYGTTTFRDFSATSGSQTLNVRASGWSIITKPNGPTITDAYVGRYGQGLGVTNDDEGKGGSGMHTIDNSVQKDFILLQFSAPVLLSAFTTTPFEVAGATDSDATIGWGSSGNAWNNTVNLNNQSSSVLTSLLTTTAVAGGNTASTRNFSSGTPSNLWLVAASFTNPDRVIDGFKLGGIKVTTPVPEPATWMTMILGFGVVGVAVRRRPKQAASAA